MLPNEEKEADKKKDENRGKTTSVVSCLFAYYGTCARRVSFFKITQGGGLEAGRRCTKYVRTRDS